MTIDMNFVQQLRNHLDQFETIPYLFVGSGLSRRYLNLESWRGLLERFTTSLEKDYSYYHSRANGSYPQAASYMAEDFHGLWYTQPAYERSRLAHQHAIRKMSSPLKIEVAEYLKQISVDSIVPAVAEEVELLKAATVDGIITTNWDLFLENVFPDYRTFVGQDSIIFQNTTGIAEIYKIHGCASDPESMILTQEDYERFNERNPYLAAKLTISFVEHPVVFLGYSLTDDNIQAILRALVGCMGADGMKQLKDRLIFVQWDPGCAKPQMSDGYIALEHITLPIKSIVTATFSPVFLAMAKLKRRMPARLLRRFKEHVYELVLTHDPGGQIAVTDFESDWSNVDVVIGVGVKQKISQIGYTGISRDDLCADVIYGGNDWESERILSEVLPRALKGNRKVPVFKYLREAGRITGANVDTSGLDERVINYIREVGIQSFNSGSHYEKQRADVRNKYASVCEMVNDLGRDKAIYKIYLLGADHIDADELLDFIKRNEQYFIQKGPAHHTHVRKLTFLYDYVQYGPRTGPGAPPSR